MTDGSADLAQLKPWKPLVCSKSVVMSPPFGLLDDLVWSVKSEPPFRDSLSLVQRLQS